MKAMIIMNQMLHQRGYKIHETTDDFFVFNNNKNNKVLLYRKIFKKLCSDIYYKKILNVYKARKELNHFILIYDNCETSSVKRLINQYVDFIYVETFHINSIQYNVTRNKLVPLHKKMSLIDKKKVCDTININKIPKLLTSDVISKFYDFRHGDLIMIKRPNSITYRIVQKSNT